MSRAASLSASDRGAVDAAIREVDEGRAPDGDDRFRADDGDGTFIRELTGEAARALEGRPADRILAWAAGVIPRFVVTSSFGAESAVLLHMLSSAAPSIPVLFLDTGLHFQETLTYRRKLASALGLTVLDVRPERSVAQQATDEREELWAVDSDRCCQLRKTVPLRQALRLYDGWATGVRRDQTAERARTPVVEARRHDGRWLVKVAPLVAWTIADVAAYLEKHDLPRNPLADEGYPSIGCAPCTTRVTPGQDPRSGRWAHEQGKSECGLHLDDDGAVVRATTTPG